MFQRQNACAGRTKNYTFFRWQTPWHSLAPGQPCLCQVLVFPTLSLLPRLPSRFHSLFFTFLLEFPYWKFHSQIVKKNPSSHFQKVNILEPFLHIQYTVQYTDRFNSDQIWKFQKCRLFLSCLSIAYPMLEKTLCSNIAPSPSSGPPWTYPLDPSIWLSGGHWELKAEAD